VPQQPTQPERTDAEIAVTVVGRDRPGIIARTAGLLAGLGMNLEDSSMTRLRGLFAMTLVCAGDPDVEQVSRALEPLRDGSLVVTVAPAPDRATGRDDDTESWLVSVHGADRLGIVAEVAGAIAERGGNITDLTTRLAGSLYVLAAEVDLARGVDAAAFTADLQRTAARLGVEVSVEPLSDDEL